MKMLMRNGETAFNKAYQGIFLIDRITKSCHKTISKRKKEDWLPVKLFQGANLLSFIVNL